MSDSFQKEIPKARVNITLDIETEGALKKKELPLKLLVIGDYSNGQGQGAVAERERININKNNFDKVMADIGPTVDLTVPNAIKNDGTDIRVKLNLNSMKDFHPERIVDQVPELTNLLAMRNLLKDLRANIIDNNQLRKRIETFAKSPEALKRLQQDMQQITTEGSQAADTEAQAVIEGEGNE